MDSRFTRTQVDHFRVLGVSPGATEEEIKKAYHKLVKVYHPDLNKAPDAVAQFQQLTASFEALMQRAKTQGPVVSGQHGMDMYDSERMAERIRNFRGRASGA